MNLSIFIPDIITNSSITDGTNMTSIIKTNLDQTFDIVVTTTETTAGVSEKPCGEALSSQTPSSVKLPGSLDALLYIVIVLMFYAFSIVILMIKYIRREREESNLRNYYHEFVSRDKFRPVNLKNHPRTFSGSSSVTSSGDGEDTITSVESEIRHSWSCKKAKRQAQTTVKNGNTFSKLRLECDEEDNYEDNNSPNGKDKRFTFLGAKKQFCKNKNVGNAFCNKQLCSKCVSDNAPTIDWDDNVLSSNLKPHKDIIEVKVHPCIEKISPQRCRLLGGSEMKSYDHFDSPLLRDNLFFPIMECDSENENLENFKECEINNSKQRYFGEAQYDQHPIPSGRSSFNDPVIVSSCSLEVSELLANMPPLGKLSNSMSNDMDTLDGLSNLESEAENQSLLNYSSSLWHNETGIRRTSSDRKSCGAKSFGASDIDNKSEKLSDRSSLLSCSLSFDMGTNTNKSYSSLPCTSYNPKSSENTNVYSSTKNNDLSKDSNKLSLSSSFSFLEKDRDKEMVRLLNDINLLTDESGVFRNLKYFLRGFYKSDTDDITEASNLLDSSPKETYFGPGSPKRVNPSTEINHNTLKGSNGDILSVPSLDDCLYSEDVVNSLGSHWAYAYDADEDGIISDTDMSSSFGDYCMGETTDSQCYSSHHKSSLKPPPTPKKINPLLAGYGAARKETKV